MNNYRQKQLKISKKMGGKDENQENDSSFYSQNTILTTKAIMSNQRIIPYIEVLVSFI